MGRDDLPLLFILREARLIHFIVILFAAGVPHAFQHGEGFFPFQRNDEVDQIKGADGVALYGVFQGYASSGGVGYRYGFLFSFFLRNRFAAAAGQGKEKEQREAEEGAFLYHRDHLS